MEIIHKFIIKIYKGTFDLQNVSYLYEEDPRVGITEGTAFLVRSTYHTMLQAAPGQVVFRRHMILNTPFIYYWGAIGRFKQELIDKNTQNKKTCKPQNYRVSYKLLVPDETSSKYEEPYKGTYLITKVWTNVTVTICRGVVQYRINIRWIKSYY